MKDIAPDANVFVASLVEKDEFHKDATMFIEAMNSKEIRAHVSRTMLVEVCGAISRRVGRKEAKEAREILEDWTREGKIKVYDFDKKRMKNAQETAINARVKGMDAITIQIAYELDIPFKTYDEEIKNKITDIEFFSHPT